MTGPDWVEFPGADSRSECFYTREAVPPVPGTPYVTTRNERYRSKSLSTIILTPIRQIAVEWHQPSHEEGLRYQLQQKHEAEGGLDTGWSNIYSDKNDYFILPALSRGK